MNFNFKNFILCCLEKLKFKIGLVIFLIFCIFIFYVLYYLFLPINIQKEVFFKIEKSQNFFEIANNLKNQNLIKSKFAFISFGILSGDFLKIKSGTHKIESNFSMFKLFNILTSIESTYTKVLIPEGVNIYEIDNILSLNNVLKEGELIKFIKENKLDIEGRLTPDTYLFFYESRPEEVIAKMQQNFNNKILPLLLKSNNPTSTLILASLLEKESPFFEDKKIIAGILLKRLENDMPLQVDASICYIKDLEQNKEVPCLPLKALDFKINSPYNTYIYKGMPPAPIANPGIDSVLAALNPEKSNYWYYLSDPKTKKAVFSETYNEHKKNIKVYLRPND